MLTDELPPRPEYFVKDVEMNRQGARDISELPMLHPMHADEVRARSEHGTIVLDTRTGALFGAGHVPRSINVSLTGQYASWAARVIGMDSEIILVAEDEARAKEAQMRLARVGIENVRGYLKDGIAGWQQAGFELAMLPQVSVEDLAAKMEHEPVRILDVRERGEHFGGAISADTVWIPLGDLRKRIGELPKQERWMVHCKSGYRSSVASSILMREGFQDVSNIAGGFDAWKAAGKPVATPSPEMAVKS
jgi:rhodanese-related sulfurtransferase